MRPVTDPAILILRRLCLVALMILPLGLAPLPALARAAPSSFADLAERLSPSVVNISTSQTVERPFFSPGPNLPPGTPFEDFFKDFFDREGEGEEQQRTRKVQSLGSGFVIDPKGFVVTNNHVIEDADEITVNFPDGASYPAEIVGRDPKTDLAVLRLTEEPEAPLPSVAFGDSNAARVGDWVIAIGNPFGLGGSVSAGIISARNRDINAGPYDDFLQTDAAINRGNSGGPLFDMDGNVIGVNTAIFSPTGGSVGVGFAVPSEIARNVVDQLRKFGETRRGWLGVRIRDVNEELAEGLGLESAMGALVEGVQDDSPAMAAGIEVGDVILAFNNREIATMRELPRAVAAAPIGETVRVTLMRKGERQTVKVTIQQLDEGTDTASDPDVSEEVEDTPSVVLGLALRPLDRELRERYALDPETEGVIIIDVDDESSAAKRGVRPGDLLVEVAQEPVDTPEDAIRLVEAEREAGRKLVLLRLKRGEENRFITVRFDEE